MRLSDNMKELLADLLGATDIKYSSFSYSTTGSSSVTIIKEGEKPIKHEGRTLAALERRGMVELSEHKSGTSRGEGQTVYEWTEAKVTLTEKGEATAKLIMLDAA